MRLTASQTKLVKEAVTLHFRSQAKVWLFTLVPQLRCGTGSPEALLPRAVPQATARAVEAELQGTSAQARELGRQEKSHLTGCFSLVFAGDTSGTGDHMPTNTARGTNWCNSCAGQDHDVREASLV